MANQPVVQVKKVTKRIGRKTIIDQLSFDIPRGEIFGFLGPNGAGKTTTIRMMVGLMSIGGGEILICGHSVSRNFSRAMQHVGAIVENPEMYKYLSGYHNLLHYARMSPGITRERIAEVVKMVGLEQRIRDKVKTYSLGMRQRLGVAQAILHKPALLILDEPTNGLDPAGIRELRDYLRRIADEEGTSVMVSSHLLSEMELMCDRVAIIQDGRLVDVQPVKATNEAGALPQSVQVIFELDDPVLAEQALRQADCPEQPVMMTEGMELTATRERTAELNRILVAAGVQVYAIRHAAVRLEDKFLEMTRRERP